MVKELALGNKFLSFKQYIIFREGKCQGTSRKFPDDLVCKNCGNGTNPYKDGNSYTC